MITLGPLNIFCQRGNSSVLIRGDKYAVQIHTLDIQNALKSHQCTHSCMNMQINKQCPFNKVPCHLNLTFQSVSHTMCTYCSRCPAQVLVVLYTLLDSEEWPPSIWTRCCHSPCTESSSPPAKTNNTSKFNKILVFCGCGCVKFDCKRVKHMDA